MATMIARTQILDDERAAPSTDLLSSLTPAERKVLRGVCSGLANKQIAHDLGITEGTVKGHMTLLMRKLRVRNRTQLALAAGAMQAMAPPRRDMPWAEHRE